MIETERLILREYTQDDFNALFEIVSDPETMTHYPAPFDEERTRRWIEWNLENYAQYGFGLWAIVLKETGEFIGDCGLTLQNIDGETLPEIGYHIHKKYWRRGFAKEAARVVRDWAFLNTDYNVLYSYMKYTNEGSWRTAMANGMKKVKEYPDPKNTISYAFAITREEWLRAALSFRKLTDFGRGIMHDILKDAYSFDERCAQCWDGNWRETDDFFFDHPKIADKYSFITCFRGEPIGFICWDPRNRPDYVEFGHNAIRTAYKGNGFGKAQLTEALRRIREYEGLKEIRVRTNSNLIAPRNYESVGFVLYDRKENPDETAFSGDDLYYRIQLKGEEYNMEFLERLIPADYGELKTAIDKRLDAFHALPKDKSCYGLVHVDFSDGNYHIDRKTGAITVFDFDNCMNCWYMFDLANLWLHNEGWTRHETDPSKRFALMRQCFDLQLQGYKSETDLLEEMLEKLPLFIDMVLIENIVDELECCAREGEELEWEDIEDAAECLINGIPYAGIGQEK